MTDRNRRYGRPLVCRLHWFGRPAGSAIAAEILHGIFSAWRRFDSAGLGGPLRRSSIGSSRWSRAWQADQCFRRRKRHCMHGIGFGACHENGDTACGRNQPEGYEGKDEAKLAPQSGARTHISELRM
jgi:hypothetical protein